MSSCQSLSPDSTADPLHLGFVEEKEEQPMETEGAGSRSAEAIDAGRGKKRPHSPRWDEDSPKSYAIDADDEWLISGSEQGDGDDDGDQGTCSPFTVDNFPRASLDHEQQSELVSDPETKRHGPYPIMLFPPFKSGTHLFDSEYNLNDKSEMSLTNVEDCLKECGCLPMDLIQFIDVKIAGYQHSHPGRAKIFGFVAARDRIRPLRNYIYRRAIDNCEAVPVNQKTGVARLSLTSPTRVISMSSYALIEFELHAQSEDGTNGDDGPIIEGCTELDNMRESRSFVEHQRLYGEKCALDIKYLVLMNAVEARVEVTVLRSAAIDDVVNMKLLAKTSGFSEVIRLFSGMAPKLGFMTSFVIAVERHNNFDFYIKGYPRDHPNADQKTPCSRWQHSFSSGYHGTDEEVADLGDFGAVSVKVSWRSHRNKGTLEWYQSRSLGIW